MAWCALHEGDVPEAGVVSLHGGRGRESRVVCIPCLMLSACAWAKTGCPFCMLTAERVTTAVEAYLETNQPLTLPEVPTDQLPAHRAGCPWVHDVLPGQAT